MSDPGRRGIAHGHSQQIVVARAVTSIGIVSPATIELTGNIITGITRRGADAVALDVTLVPGFVDLQVNGSDEIDVASASAAELLRLDHRLAARGTTAWLPTIVTRPIDTYSAPLETVGHAINSQASDGEASILGVHLEGPFLGRREGAHRREHIVGADLDFVASLPDTLRLMTVAPEAEGAVELVAALVARDVVVSIGHTEATRVQLDAVYMAGASLVTHLFNAMPGLHHRHETVAGWSLTNDAIPTAVIADMGHVAAHALTVAIRCKPLEQLIAVSDSVAHLSDGKLRPGFVSGGDGAPAQFSNGTIAGSTASLADCFANLVATGASLELAVAATSTNPSRILGAADRGAIAVGARADLVALDDANAVSAVWRSGRQVL